MARIRRLIPFKMLPASWGLKGKTRKIAEAEYYYDGLDLDIELVKINYPVPELRYQYERELLRVKKRYNLIDRFQARCTEVDIDYQEGLISEREKLNTIAEIEADEGIITEHEASKKIVENDYKFKHITELDYKIKQLEFDLAEQKIKQNDYDREVATLKNEPYVNVIGMGIENSAEGYFELDWNDAFVKYLYDEGLTGVSDEDVVNKWFNRVCRTVLLQEGADLDFGFQEEVAPDVEYRSYRQDKTSKPSK